mgnify:CR=1 FL=1
MKGQRQSTQALGEIYMATVHTKADKGDDKPATKSDIDNMFADTAEEEDAALIAKGDFSNLFASEEDDTPVVAEQPAVHVPDTPAVAEQPAEGHTGAAESDTGAAEPPKKLAKIPVPTPSELAAQTASAVRPAESDIAGGDNGVAEPPKEPDLALVTVEGKASGAKNPIGVAGYKIDEETKSLVLAAECSTDVPIKVRNRLYAAMGRVFDAAANGRNPLNIQPAVVARYVDEKGSQAASFKMWKEFVADTSCATMTFDEKHVLSSERYMDKQYERLTQLDLEIRYDAATNPAGKAHVEFLMKNSKSFPHPDFPNNKSMRQYKVFKHLTDGTAASQKHTISLAASSGVTDSSAALALGEYQDKRAVQFLDPLHDGGADLEQEAGDKVIKKRIPKGQTPEQQAAKEEKAKRAKDISNIKKSCTAVKTMLQRCRP